MNTKRICASLLAVGILTQGITSYAAKITANQSNVTDRVDVVIDSESNVAGKPVIVKIEKPSQVLGNAPELNFITSGYTDESGKFSFSYINDKHTGFLDITADIEGVKLNDVYLKMGVAEYREIVNALNSGMNSTPPTYTDIKSKIEYYEKGLALDRTRFNTLKNQEAVYNIMVNNTAFKGKVTTSEDVKNDFYASVLMQCINEDKSCFKAVICEEPYKAVVEKFSTLIPELLENSSQEIVDAVQSGIGNNYTNISKLTSDIELLLLKKSIASAEHWNDVKTILAKYSDAGKIYIDSGKSSDAFKALMGTEFNSYKEYESAINNYAPQTKKSSTVGGGGGGIVAAQATQPENRPATSVTNTEPAKGIPIFSDMEDAKWAIAAVNFTTEKGITSGVGDGKFEPNRIVTRAEATKLVLSMIGAELIDSEQKFNDVPQDSWAFKYVNTAYELNIVSGRDENTFDPNSQVTRQEMAVMVYRALVYKNGEPEKAAATDFIDKDSIADWSYEAVNYLYSKKIMVGATVPGGYLFKPSLGITRAEGATVIYNVLK